ncbi:molybdenum cofactor biosynthesis protein MoaB [Deinococcus sp. HMF7604]|uniref:MogA/MoaB family molybdenum cofactor biosynthesis protein n=1 Tax=Deinococcus betulae TaxID=2873312 RepID=UPI001CCA2FCA|nr:molybdenum cofactor biosynthesis protein B [Deinococcus betulae]MBZ9749563.1 molybdenum cofactor biosynthesis protein MoaB [Deinococcus betulae]
MTQPRGPQQPTSSAPESGAQSHRARAPRTVRAAVLTVSDTRTPETDDSGAYLRAQLEAGGHEVVNYRVVRDDAVDIRSALVAFSREAAVVLCSGGTGITGRDVTVPVVESIITKPIPGFGELFRMLSYQQVGGAAMLSRAVAGLVRGAVVFAMPGSLNAVQTAWDGILKDEIGHLVYELERQGQPGVLTAPGLATSGAASPSFSGLSAPGVVPMPGTGGGAAAGLGRHRKSDRDD